MTAPERLKEQLRKADAKLRMLKRRQNELLGAQVRREHPALAELLEAARYAQESAPRAPKEPFKPLRSAPVMQNALGSYRPISKH